MTLKLITGQVKQKELFTKYLVVFHLLFPPLLELLKLDLQLILHLPLFVQHLLVALLQQGPLRHHLVLQGRAQLLCDKDSLEQTPRLAFDGLGLFQLQWFCDSIFTGIKWEEQPQLLGV